MIDPRVLDGIAEASPEDCAPILAAVAARMAQLQQQQGTAASPDEYLSAAEAARRLGMSAAWLYKQPHLPFRVRLGRRVVFSAAGLTRFVRQRQQAGR